ncbi:MAG: TerC family protein [Jiangellaceae bacterium]|nr:TerC family protein [Jiangellaceae bacterium]
MGWLPRRFCARRSGDGEDTAVADATPGGDVEASDQVAKVRAVRRSLRELGHRERIAASVEGSTPSRRRRHHGSPAQSRPARPVPPAPGDGAEETSGRRSAGTRRDHHVQIHSTAWLLTIAVTLTVIAADLVIIGRRPHEPSMREASSWVLLYIALAVLFGSGVWVVSGAGYAGEFFAGWLTEYSLSVDNLFVFVVIMSRFAVPRQYQQTVLLIGIILALVLRGLFIALGAAAISAFSWVFYLFGAFLVWTAITLARHGEDDERDYQENVLVRRLRRVLPSTREYHGVRLWVRANGRRLVTPMLIVMVAIGTTDVLFALDSIPAIYGLTKEPYLVFTANAFALMGLRQLYFLIGGLLRRLVYLSYGLALVLGFIGVKLILEALHSNELPFINGGEPVPWAPEVPIWLSLTVIFGTVLLTAVISLLKTRRDVRRAANRTTRSPAQ